MLKCCTITSRRWFPRRIARRSCWRDWLVWFMRRCFEWIPLLSWVEIALEAKMCNFDEMRAQNLECDICHLLDRGTRYWRLLLIELLHYRSEGFGTLSWIFNYQQHIYAYLFVKSDQGLDKMAQLSNLLDIITKKRLTRAVKRWIVQESDGRWYLKQLCIEVPAIWIDSSNFS